MIQVMGFYPELGKSLSNLPLGTLIRNKGGRNAERRRVIQPCVN